MRKVMVFGTFDKLHQGHLDFFKQAKKYGNYLIVVVARDLNVKKIKGHKPVNNELCRLAKIKIQKIVNKAVLGDKKNFYTAIRKFKPNVICLGYDQKFFIANLKKEFPKIKVVRLKAFKPHLYKSSKIYF